MTFTSPGWYADPQNPSIERWWDGSAFTYVRPVAGVVAILGAPSAVGISPKSRTVAVILGFFLGWLGVDRFYLGNIGLGVAKLLIGWATLGIWPLIDWIIILAGGAHDGDGLRVVNWN